MLHLLLLLGRRWPSEEVKQAVLLCLLRGSRLCELLGRLRWSNRLLCALEGSRSFRSQAEASAR